MDYVLSTGQALEDVNWDDVIKDCFIYKNMEVVVLKNEAFDEFIDEVQKGKAKKLVLIGKLYRHDDIVELLPISKDLYKETLDYYTTLKKAFEEVVLNDD